jgi:peptidoglycan/LPS O-acetylase OafA/YrhL
VSGIDFRNFVFHVLLIHNFEHAYCNNPRALWFIGIIFQFYMIFPLLFSVLKKNVRKFWGIVVLLYCLNLAVTSYVYSHMSPQNRFDFSIDDVTVFGYISILAFGMYMGRIFYSHNDREWLLLRNTIKFLTLLVCLIVCAIFWRSGSISFDDLYRIGKLSFPLFSAFFIVCSLSVYPFVTRNNFTKFMAWLSVGTYFSYLFHEFLFRIFSILNNSYIVGTFVGLPAVLVICVFMQKYYNLLFMKRLLRLK